MRRTHTIDPLYQTVGNNSKLTKSVPREIEEKNESGDIVETITPLPNDVRGLEISQEDRFIGVVSSKLYWNYFRSGVHWSTIWVQQFVCALQHKVRRR